MNDARDPNLIIGAWLDEGPTELPQSTRRAITTSVRTIDQRRGIALPWGSRPFASYLGPMLAAAAVFVAVVGMFLLAPFGRAPSVGPPVASANPSPTSSDEPVDTPAPEPVGRIAFTRYDSDIGPLGDNVGTFVINADGTGEQRLDFPFPSDGVVWSADGSRLLLPNAQRDEQPFRPAIANADGSGYQVLEVEGAFQDMWCGAWSPDGGRLLCSIADDNDPSVDGIYSVAADGSDLQRLTNDPFDAVDGSVSDCFGGDMPGDFSPDGRQFVFVRVTCGTGADPVSGQTAEIHVGTIGEEGTRAITVPGFLHVVVPSAQWSHDGQWIVFGGSSHLLYRVRPDGTDRQTIPVATPSLDAFLYRPDWSPDGRRIVFSMVPSVGADSELYSVAADGSDLRRITQGFGAEDYASWGPTSP
jgi:Tol biopolymer transport system component